MPTEADSLLPICFIIPFARNPSFTEEPIDLPHPPSTVVILSWVQLKVNFLDFQVHTFAVSSPATSPRSFQQHHPSRPAVLERAPKSCFVCIRVGSRLLAMTDPELLPKMVNFVSFRVENISLPVDRIPYHSDQEMGWGFTLLVGEKVRWFLTIVGRKTLYYLLLGKMK